MKIASTEHYTEAASLPINVPQVCPLASPISVHFLKGSALILPTKRKHGGAAEAGGDQGEQSKDYVTMLMAMIRLGDPYDSDIVITLNVPDKITDEEMAGQQLGETEAYKKYLETCEKEFKSMMETFVIPSDQAVKDLLGM